MKVVKNKKLKRLYLLVVIVPKGKRAVVQDLLEDFQVTAFLRTGGRGTSEDKHSKDVLFHVIREDQVKAAIYVLEDKTEKFRNNMSMVYAVPLESVIGASSYLFLAKEGK